MNAPLFTRSRRMQPLRRIWREMDDRAATIAARHPDAPATYGEARSHRATLLESTRYTLLESARYADRWECASGASVWYCKECGSIVEDAAAGCAVCGCGDPNETDDA